MIHILPGGKFKCGHSHVKTKLLYLLHRKKTVISVSRSNCDLKALYSQAEIVNQAEDATIVPRSNCELKDHSFPCRT